MTAATRSPPKAARRFDSREQEVYLNLWRTYDRLRALEEEMFAPYGLSAQQYNTLRLLADARPSPLPTRTLGARLISRAPDMTRMLDRLERRELIQRQRRSDNRRVVDVTITAQGLALLEELAEPVRQCHRRQLGHLSRAELNSLTALLKTARAPHEVRGGASIAD